MPPLKVPPRNEWTPWKEGMCTGCQALCCRTPVSCTMSDLVRLGLVSEGADPEETAARMKASGDLLMSVPKRDLFVLKPKPDGWCRYLDVETRLCRVYENRPDVCRKFPAEGTRQPVCPSKRR